jgi:hypothetical protein
MKLEVLTVIKNDSGWTKVNDIVIDLNGDQIAEAREQTHGRWVTTLLPLLGPEYKLAGRGEVKVQDRPAYGVIVSRADRRDVQLFFDKETHLLVKTEQRVKDESGKEMTGEGRPPAAQGDRTPRRHALHGSGHHKLPDARQAGGQLV